MKVDYIKLYFKVSIKKIVYENKYIIINSYMVKILKKLIQSYYYMFNKYSAAEKIK